jgi:hypothetical protein
VSRVRMNRELHIRERRNYWVTHISGAQRLLVDVVALVIEGNDVYYWCEGCGRGPAGHGCANVASVKCADDIGPRGPVRIDEMWRWER